MEKPTLLENGLFIWCFFTSLIFAELGKQTLAFLGTPGEQLGFYLNLIVYFATHFSGARTLFQRFIDKENAIVPGEAAESILMTRVALPRD